MIRQQGGLPPIGMAALSRFTLRSIRVTGMAKNTGSGKALRPTKNWKEKFLLALAQTSNVSRSADIAGVDTSTVYRLRSSESEFARRWLAALWEGYEHLELEVLRRLREGDLKTESGEKYDFAAAIRLLSAHRDTAAQAKAAQRNVSAAEIRASIDRKVEEIRYRVMQEKSARDACDG